jgi:hypothetical protein
MIINEEYLSSTALSQSKLKKLLVHPQLFINYNNEDDTDEPKETTMIGDAVDLILTQSSDAFYDAFYTTDVEKPGAMMGVFVWQLFINRDSSDAEQIAYEKSGFKIKLDKVRERFEKEGKYYYEALLESNGKTVITSAQKSKIEAIVESLKNNEFTSKWINGSDELEVHKQVVVEFEYQGHKCKGLLDLVVVNKKTGIVYPIDLKTSSSPTNFWMNMFWKFRYDLQAAFYTYGIKASGLVEKLGGTELHPFRFIVENQDHPGSPLIYQVSKEVLWIGQNGGEFNGRKYEGFAQAINRYEWHTMNDLWQYPMQDYMTNGVRIIEE